VHVKSSALQLAQDRAFPHTHVAFETDHFASGMGKQNGGVDDA
jgi:hypothetical protein